MKSEPILELKNEPFAECCELYRNLLDEWTRTRVPHDWAMSTGNQGAALMVLAERRGDAKMAKLAVRQIEAAATTFLDGGDPPSAAILYQRH
jgi:hypothetical protein